MKKFLKGLLKRGDNRGLSLVEVLCAVAILGLVSGVIGGVVVVSARTYRKGISETGIQQAAQLAANNIGNIVKDSYKVLYGESGTDYYLEDGKETTREYGREDETELVLYTNNHVQYKVRYYGDKLYYSEYNSSDGTGEAEEVLAENITEFQALTGDFETNRTITLKMTVKDETTGRNIPMEYTMKSRNESGAGVEYTETPIRAQIYIEDSVIMVPGETYQIPLSVYGSSKLAKVCSQAEGLIVGTITSSSVEVTVDKDATAGKDDPDVLALTMQTQEMNDDNTAPLDTSTCKIKIRRVENVSVSHTVNTKGTANGMMEEEGTVFTFSAAVSGKNLSKQVAYAYDDNYKTAQAVTWSWKVTVNGTETDNCTASAYTGGGYDGSAKTYTKNDATWSNDYIEFTSCTEDATLPQIVFTVKKALPSNFVLTVTAVSKHAAGTNKAGSDYAAVEGSDSIKARTTRVSEGQSIILEPNESGTVTLNMKGGISGDVTFVPHDASDWYSAGNADGTRVEGWAVGYDKDAAGIKYKLTVDIVLGRDEAGSGADSDTPYTFTIDVYTDGIYQTTITVHVRRIDKMSIEVYTRWLNTDGQAMETTTCDFRGRINVDNGVTDQNLLTYLIRDLDEDGNAVVSESIRNNLATKISWELKDGSSTLASGAVICYGAEGTDNDLSNVINCETGIKIDDPSDFDTEYYEFEGIKHPRVTESNGSYKLDQAPELDVTWKSKNCPNGATFTVTMEMLHPLGSYELEGGSEKSNATGREYGTAVAEYTLTAKEIEVSTDLDTVYVEPGQGTDSTDASDEELVIPIKVKGAVYSLGATISGNTSSSTRLSEYPTVQNDYSEYSNPYLVSNSTSTTDQSIWNLGLVIGKDETGDNGIITVTVMPYIVEYNSKTGENELVEVRAYSFELAVRRVNEVEVKEKNGSTFVSVNTAGNTITLEAYPTGYSGTDYYAMQKDGDDEACYWETEGHGEYQSPSKMRWTMSIDGGETWAALSEWTGYIDPDSIKTTADTSENGKNNYKATVTFTLLEGQTLPSETKIRAYSLHAEGTETVDGTKEKRNKAGAKYATVYGEWPSGNTYVVAEDFQRADDYTFATFDSIRSTYFSDSAWNSSQRTFFRYKKSSEDWNSSNMQYYLMDSAAETTAFLSGNNGSLLFLPTEEYHLEIVNVVYGTATNGNKYIYYPLDESLLEEGKGWAENGYQLWDGSFTSYGYVSGTYEKLKKLTDDAYKYYLIPETEIYFQAPATTRYVTYDKTIDEVAQSVGSATSPFSLSYDDGWTYDSYFAVELAPTYFNIDKTQAYFTSTIEKLGDDGTWSEMLTLYYNKTSMSEGTYRWFLQVSCPVFQIYHVYSDASGTYRICATVNGMSWRKISGNMFEPTYTSYEIDSIKLYDTTTDEGIMYLKLN